MKGILKTRRKSADTGQTRSPKAISRPTSVSRVRAIIERSRMPMDKNFLSDEESIGVNALYVKEKMGTNTNVKSRFES